MSQLGETTSQPNVPIIDTGIVSYNPITGVEAAIIACREIDKLKERINNQPLLIEGLCFHKIRMQLAWRMFAYPGDVPVPKELSDVFDIAHDDFNELAFAAAMNNSEKAKALIKKLEDYSTELALKHTALKKFIADSEVVVSDILEAKDEGQPDALRLKNDLPINTVQTHGGRVVEAPSKLNFGNNKTGTASEHVNS